jgi:hypothetical protein
VANYELLVMKLRERNFHSVQWSSIHIIKKLTVPVVFVATMKSLVICLTNSTAVLL